MLAGFIFFHFHLSPATSTTWHIGQTQLEQCLILSKVRRDARICGWWMSMLTVVIRRMHKMGVVGGFKNPVGWRKEADRYSYHPWAISDQKSILHTWTGTNSSIHRLPGSGLMSPRDKNVKHNSTFYNIIPVGWRKEADRYWPYPHHHT